MRITLPSGTPAELVLPAEKASHGLVIACDIGGLRPLFQDMCTRLCAEQGWAVCAPEPWPGREHLSVTEKQAQVATLSDQETLDNFKHAAAATNCETVNLIGFCMGGMYALKAAPLPDFTRIVAFYGMIHVPEHWQSDTQQDPLAAVHKGDPTKIMAIIGEEDQWTPPQDVDKLEATGVAVKRYAGAEHGFVHDPERPAHRPDDACNAWERAIAFLHG